MFSGNYRLAIARVRAAKTHSVLTMFGIIVGIVSVVTIVSLGEGVKRQVVNQSGKLGSNVLTVRPGNFVERDSSGDIVRVDAAQAYGFGSGSLSERDIQVINQVPDVSNVIPLNLFQTDVVSGDVSYSDGFVLGTDAIFPDVIQNDIAYGNYFTDGEEGRNLAVIGRRVAEQLFKENIPIGQAFTVRGEEFIVRGVFDEFGSSVLGQGIDLNKAVFVPRPALKKLAGDSALLTQILVRTKTDKAGQVVVGLRSQLKEAHGGAQDFTILKQDENITIASDMFKLLTKFVVVIGIVSLAVGGIGIMNIMLASVSERTYEIGIRKAVGATNRQIRNQFMAEAVVLGLVGGALGVIGSFATSFLIRISTNLHPVISWPVVGLAVVASLIVGIVFGTVPAVKAARKDPITALRGSA